MPPAFSQPVLASDATPPLPELLLEGLRQKGVRITPQREQVVQLFTQLPEGDHLSAEALYILLRSEGQEASLATLYRTLKLLAQHGVLREIRLDAERSHYELWRHEEDPHHHLVCSRCGLTEEFESPAMLVAATTEAEKRQFKIEELQVKLYVSCLPHKANCPLRPSEAP